MPETMIKVRWPDNEIEEIYSPSSIVHEYFKAGDEFGIKEFEDVCQKAFEHAIKRVVEVRGFACTSAHATLSDIMARIGKEKSENAKVQIIDIS